MAGAVESEAGHTRARRRRLTRKIVVAGAGGAVVAVGVAMIVLPGPAVVVIPAGLGILATEFAWARRLLRRLQRETAAALRRSSAETRSPPPEA